MKTSMTSCWNSVLRRSLEEAVCFDHDDQFHEEKLNPVLGQGLEEFRDAQLHEALLNSVLGRRHDDQFRTLSCDNVLKKLLKLCPGRCP